MLNISEQFENDAENQSQGSRKTYAILEYALWHQQRAKQNEKRLNTTARLCRSLLSSGKGVEVPRTWE